MKTASLPIKVALIGLCLHLLPALTNAQTRYDMYGTSAESRRVFRRIVGDGRGKPATNPGQPTNNPGSQLVVQPGYAGQQIIIQPGMMPPGPVPPAPPKLGKLIVMSLHMAPTICINTADGAGQYAGFQSNNIGIRYSIGPSLDYFFYRDRYALSTGIWFSVRRSSYQMPGTFGQPQFTPGLTDQKSVYNLQYVQVPLLLKLFANDLAPGIQLYVQTGWILDIKTAENAQDKTRNALYQFANSTGTYQRQYDRAGIDWLLGAGIQYAIGANSALIFGLSYQRGLTNIATANQLDSRLRTVSVDLGLKF